MKSLIKRLIKWIIRELLTEYSYLSVDKFEIFYKMKVD
jgi:hypothetical protein